MAQHLQDDSSTPAGADVAAPGPAASLPLTTQPRSTAGFYRVERLARIDEASGAAVWALLADSLSTRQAADRVASAYRASTGKATRVIERQLDFVRAAVRTRPVVDDAHLRECPPT